MTQMEHEAMTNGRGDASPVIDRIETVIADVPIKRTHRFPNITIDRQTYLYIFLHTRCGVTGCGETVVPGGPWWSGDSIEAANATIETYLAPALIGARLETIRANMMQLDRLVHANSFAKAGLEAAMYDALGKFYGIPVSSFFGGLVRDSIPVVWPLASGDVEKDISEALRLRDAGFSNRFKVKMGAVEPRDDVRHIEALAAALGSDTLLVIDLNGSWDFNKAAAYLPPLIAAGVDIVEQPIERWNREGLRDLSMKLDAPLMADESVCTPADAFAMARMRAAQIFALKPMKHGGLMATEKVAALGEAAGIPCFGGTFLESGLGVAAALNLFGALSNCTAGCELIGPHWLREDILAEPLEFKDFAITVPTRPGLGVEIDRYKLEEFKRR